MQNRVIGAVATLVMVAAFSPRASAQKAPMGTGTGIDHDISGVWNAGIGVRQPADNAAGGGTGLAANAGGGAGDAGEYGGAAVPAAAPRGGAPGGGAAANAVAPMTPWAQARWDANTQETKADRPITIDPAYNCHPPGLPHAFNNGAFPIEILQTPQRILIFFESAHLWREIWMDGREIPKDHDPTWMGISVGHWEGDDLVVDTGDFNDLTWLDPAGHPHSQEMKLTERYHRPDHDRLQVTFTIDDPKAYTATWQTRNNFVLKPGWEVGEAFCIPEDQSNFQKHVLEPNARPTPVSKKK